MTFVGDYLFRLMHSTPERKASRGYLKRAQKGDTAAYLALTANYINLSLVYFGISFHDEPERRTSRVEQVFTALRQNLPYAERLSDFEYMLFNVLVESIPHKGSISSQNSLVKRLRLLDAEIRFAVVAYEFENWPQRWVALLMRVRPNALHTLLSKARCELCGISWESLSGEERDCLETISRSMSKSPNIKANKALCARVTNSPRVGTIRALWLELRSELVEVRHRYLLNFSERELLLNNVLSTKQPTNVNQPKLVDRVVNSVHFTRHAKIKVS